MAPPLRSGLPMASPETLSSTSTAPAVPLGFATEWRVGVPGLRSLAREWETLARSAHPDSVFHGAGFALAAAETHPELEPRCLVVRERGEVVALVPWVALPGHCLGLPVRRWSSLGGVPTGTTRASRASRWFCRDLRWGWGATSPLLCSRRDRQAVLGAALERSLAELGADLLHLQGLAPECVPERLGLRTLVTSTEPNWVAPSGGPELGRLRLSKRTKKRLATGLAALERMPGYGWSVVAGHELAESDIDEIAELERKSTKSATGASILTSGPRNRSFLTKLLRHEPSCRVGRLRIATGLVAWALGLRAGARGEGLLLAHDPAHDEHYPGLLAYVLVEEALGAEHALTSYSFGRGEEFWKTGRLLGIAEPRVDLTVFGSGVRGRLLAFLHGRIQARRSRARSATNTSADPDTSPSPLSHSLDRAS